MPLEKATIENLYTHSVTKCMFNPKEYTFSKTSDWEFTRADTSSQPVVKFKGGSAGNLTLDLLFDTYDPDPTLGVVAGSDVRSYTAGLWELMEVVEWKWKNSPAKLKSPPYCQFKWGNFWSFDAVIVSINQTFTLFSANGTPLRATLKVELKQIEEIGKYPGQNPTSGGSPGEHIHVIHEGETLAGIAYQEYGDSSAWRHIALNNAIPDPRRLRAGQSLLIKPLPTI